MHASGNMPLYQPEEDCGVFGIYGGPGMNVAEITYFGLYALQHRGQESAGIAVSDGKHIQNYRNKGLVPEAFDKEALSAMRGHAAIGHVRYSTFGYGEIINASPIVAHYKGGTIALAHNGNIINADALRKKLMESGCIFQTSTDIEVVLNLLARSGRRDIISTIKRLMELIHGAYALVVMTDNALIGVRDPLGIRPLAIGRLDGHYVLASESCAFDAVNAEFLRDVKPGEIVYIDENGIQSYNTAEDGESALCIFEFVYFARADSIIDNIDVYRVRHETGRLLAQYDDSDYDMVLGVPDSALPAALGYSDGSGIPYGDGLAKNRYVGRSFIQPEQRLRELSVRTKLNAMTRNVRGKRVIMIDDSIVRGTTSIQTVEMLKKAGAKEVHMRISSPPVTHPCFYGIDTPDSDELIGSSKSVEDICKYIGADSLKFIKIKDLLTTVCSTCSGMCTACFDGNYPVPLCRRKLNSIDI